MSKTHRAGCKEGEEEREGGFLAKKFGPHVVKKITFQSFDEDRQSKKKLSNKLYERAHPTKQKLHTAFFLVMQQKAFCHSINSTEKNFKRNQFILC